ncbi:MAG: T9SS type A sorting domain-containing protein [Bacteroidales bacterium]
MKKIILLAIVTLSVNIVTAQWTQANGPHGGYIRSMAISDTTVFAGTYGGAVWKRSLSEFNRIKEISNNESNIVIYPNPNRGKFTIAQTNDIKSIEIYNAMGEIVYKSWASNAKLQIDISAQPKGIYFVKVDNGKKVHVKKLVLN